jgi:hypothetical protein
VTELESAGFILVVGNASIAEEEMKIYARIFKVQGVMPMGAMLNIQSYQRISLTTESTEQTEDLRKDCIVATIRGIKLEIVKHQKWISTRKKRKGTIEGRLKRLVGDLEK